MQFGLQLWAQGTSWPTFRDTATRADAAGWDSVWTFDHLLAIFGPWEQPILDGWGLLSALGPLTTRARLGLMVGANTFRNPGLTAKIVTTLDHISGGRAILGLGGAWFDREHEAFGLEFGPSPGWRLDRLDEAVMLIRRLLDGERFDHAGPAYPMRDALCAPRPLQAHLPILIGGSGPTKTLRIVAERADAWNTAGDVAEVARSVEILRGHADALGRDMATIEQTISFPVIIRDDAAAAQVAFDALLAANAAVDPRAGRILLGSPAAIADALAPYRALGFETLIVRMPAPYDVETIDRMVEVRELLRP